MKTFVGIEGTTYIFHGSSDPEVIYKGISFNEMDIEDAIQAENEDVDLDEYLRNPENHDSIRSMLDEWIFAQQTPQRINEMKARAKEVFDETNFRLYMIEDIISWSKSENSAFQKLLDFVRLTVKEDLSNISFLDDTNEIEFKIDYIDDKTLMDFCSANNISIDQPYIVYLQNDSYYDNFWSEEELVKGMKDFIDKKNNGLYAIIKHERESVFYEGIIDEDFKSDVLKKLNAEIPTIKGVYAKSELSDKQLEEVWLALEDVPLDFDDEHLDGYYSEDIELPHQIIIKEGTEKEEVWEFFDEHHSKGVAYLLYDFANKENQNEAEIDK